MISQEMVYGLEVRVLIDPGCGKNPFETVYHNVTEIHYNYKSMGIGERTKNVVFASDVHSSSFIWKIHQVVEFETAFEESIAPSM